MYYCEDCKEFFEKPRETEPVMVPFGDRMVPYGAGYECPNCGSLGIYDAKKCELCDEWINPEERICGECFDENKTAAKAFEFGIENRTEVEVNGLLAHIYGDRINDILMEMYAAAPKELNNAEADAFIADCKYDFIDFLIREKKEEQNKCLQKAGKK